MLIRKPSNYHFLFLFSLLLGCQSINYSELDVISAELPDVVDFNFHIKPLLSDRCFKCHGPDANQRKGDLRLDQMEAAYSETSNESSHKTWVIKRGSVASSELTSRILSKEPAYMMPPPESHLALSNRDKALLLRWIDQGADFKPHWSFRAPLPKSLPQVNDKTWARNPIDLLIQTEMEKVGLQPAPQAEKLTLLRRLSLDLTGLPPTLQEIESFLADPSEKAFEKVIDRLLASPHYGERLTLEWLDAARYADSHGYQDDGLRNVWPWRDWVINAFNTDMRFDTFLLWQLAGDMLPNPTQDQLLATCFSRNHPQTQEGGVVDEEYRVEYVADRTNTLGKAILGLTVECARCHDHKYDPISQEDYYSLYAYFNNNNESGIVPYNGEAAPTIILADEKAKKELIALREKISSLEEKLTPNHYRRDFEAWANKIPNKQKFNSLDKGLVADFSFERETNISADAIYLDKPPRPKSNGTQKDNSTFAYFNKRKGKLDAHVWGHIDDRPLLQEGKYGEGLFFVGDGGVRFNRDLDYDRDQPFSVSLWIKVQKKGVAGPIFGKTNGDFEGYRGWLCKLNEDGTLSFQLNHVWPDNAIDFQTKEPIPINEWLHVALTYDGSSQASGVRFYINGEQPSAVLYADNLHKSILHGVKGSNWSNQPFLLGMELRKSIQDMMMDELKIYDRQLASSEIKSIIKNEPLDLTALEKDELLEIYLLSKSNPIYDKTSKSLRDLRKKENRLLTDQPEVMVMRERKYPKSTYILDRGAYDAPTQKVKPGIPQELKIESQSFAQDRLGLAMWTIHPQNPLTARVMVNRLWNLCYGRGIVATQEDFGSQGNLPSHPALLDWLALRFIELDWSVKSLLKEIVTSATYRQQSRMSHAAKEVDPQNMRYSYFPAHRLPAEIIRDQALAGSGLLARKIGGPSVYPYQPSGIWKALATRNATEYRQQHGDSLYRRSMYTVWKRSSPPPSMLNFDAPDRYYCVVRRQQTSTPLQSLVLLNDPQFLEAARVLAENASLEMFDSTTEVVNHLCLRLLGRSARSTELHALTNLYEECRERFRIRPEDASAILDVGEYPQIKSVDKVDLASSMIVASTIMNYDEFVTKR